MSDETTTEQLAEIEEQAAEYTPPEGWRVLAVGERLQEGDEWIRPWDGRWISVCVGSDAAVSEGQYIRQIASEPDCQTEEIQYLRREISTLQNQLGESRQRVTQLEELVGSLRTINEAQEKTVRLAGQENTDLQHRLDVVAAEWAEQAGTINGLRAQLDRRDAQIRDLQIELDALQQAPQAETMAATPPATEDRFEQGWDAGTARAVETIAEWLEPIKGAIDAADNQDELARAGFFAIDTIRHLPAIMRHLTGLTPED